MLENKTRKPLFSGRPIVILKLGLGSKLPFWPVVWILIERNNKFDKFWNERSLTKESNIRLVILQQYQ